MGWGCHHKPSYLFGGNDGTAFVNIFGGTAPYFYQWNDSNNQTTSMAVGLSAGAYTVSVTDQNGCMINPINVGITQPGSPISASFDSMESSCWGSNDGSISVSATGGSPGYQYVWNNSVAGAENLNIGAGNYTVTITDINNCVFIESITLSQPAPAAGTLSSVDALCFGDFNGSISVDTAFGGTGPYIYSLDGENFQTDTLFQGLSAGNYTVTLQDINGCEGSSQISISQPFELDVNLGEDQEIVLGDRINLEAVVNTFDTLDYIWEPSPFLSCLDCPNPGSFCFG